MLLGEGIGIPFSGSGGTPPAGFAFTNDFSYQGDGATGVIADFGDVLGAFITSGTIIHTGNIWYKRDSTGVVMILQSKYQNSLPQISFYFNTGNKLVLDVFDTDTANLDRYKTTATFTDTTGWHMATYIYDPNSPVGSQVTLYHDGALEAQDAVGGAGTFVSIKSGAGPYVIGARGAGAGTYAGHFHGHLTQSTFFSAGLSGGEITTLYNAGTPNDPRTNPAAGSLQHWPPLGEGDVFSTEWCVFDRSGKALHGTSSNQLITGRTTDVP